MSRKQLTKIGKWFVLPIAIVVTIAVARYVVGINSEAFAFARTVISNSEVLKHELGDVTRVRMDVINGFGIHQTSRLTDATFKLTVEGDYGSRHLTIDVQRIDEKWHVVKTSVPL